MPPRTRKQVRKNSKTDDDAARQNDGQSSVSAVAAVVSEEQPAKAATRKTSKKASTAATSRRRKSDNNTTTTSKTERRSSDASGNTSLWYFSTLSLLAISTAVIVAVAPNVSSPIYGTISTQIFLSPLVVLAPYLTGLLSAYYYYYHHYHRHTKSTDEKSLPPPTLSGAVYAFSLAVGLPAFFYWAWFDKLVLTPILPYLNAIIRFTKVLDFVGEPHFDLDPFFIPIFASKIGLFILLVPALIVFGYFIGAGLFSSTLSSRQKQVTLVIGVLSLIAFLYAECFSGLLMGLIPNSPLIILGISFLVNDWSVILTMMATSQQSGNAQSARTSKLVLGMTTVTTAIICWNVLNVSQLNVPLPPSQSSETRDVELLNPYVILNRRESITGYISAVDEQGDRSVRVLRSDHSLLGGIWMQGDYKKESVYASFYLPILLQYVKQKTSKPKSSSKRRILQIGLGAGIAARSILDHQKSWKVDIVELDPVVWEFAHDYFYLNEYYKPINASSKESSLPTPAVRSSRGNVYIMDGRDYVEQVARSNGTKYDYMIHDIFSGGIVMERLFSIQAFQVFKSVLKPKSGVLAVNFVGEVNGVAIKTIVFTLGKVFQHLKLFVEPAPTPEAVILENIVIFASDSPIEFNKVPTEVLKSVGGIEHYVLSQFESWQSPLPQLNETEWSVITDSENPLAKLQVASALEHWKVMRDLFGRKFWIEY